MRKTIAMALGVTLFASLAAVPPSAVKEVDVKAVKAKTPDSVAVIQVEYDGKDWGRIVIRFFPDVAPGHVRNFRKLANRGFYDGVTFHRVIPGFMIQGGDPNSKDNNRSNDGMGGPGYTINAEFSNIPHEPGIVSMARRPDPNSAGSQFFIMVGRAPTLDRQYTVFGEVIEGMEVVNKIAEVPTDKANNPEKKVVMKSVKIIPYEKYKKSR